MFRKHLFYLSSDQLDAYTWERGELVAAGVFSNDRAGIDAFMDFVDAAPYAPVYLLADLIEEDFSRASLPHVGGRSGRQLLQRRLVQQYRETPYRHVQIQGRDSEGRQDDIALLSALTNPAIVAPWIEALELLKIPIAGLYSATLISCLLQKKLGRQHEHTLLVTQQTAGLRQSYFLDGQLKFSRLTPAVDRDGLPVSIARETDKTQQFLTSVRLVGRGDLLHTLVVVPGDEIGQLAPQCPDSAETAYHFIALETAAAKAGVTPQPQARLADYLLLTLLGKELPANQYALGDARRYFHLWRARLAMYSTGALIMTCSLLWVGGNIWGYFHASHIADRMYSEADQYDARYRIALSSMPPAVAKTASMKAAVTIERLLLRQGPQPLPIMSKLSEALERVPQIRILQLDWRVNVPGSKADALQTQQAMAGGQPGQSLAPISSLMLGIPTRPPQVLHIEAEIVGQQDNYRSVVDSMNQFTQELARQPRMTVEIEQLPLDTRSNVKLSGKAGAATGAPEANAKFILNLVWNP
jgi:hypothetical protein